MRYFNRLLVPSSPLLVVVVQVVIAFVVVVFACPAPTTAVMALANARFIPKENVNEAGMISLSARGGGSTYTDTVAVASFTAPIPDGKGDNTSSRTLTTTRTSRIVGGDSRELEVASPPLAGDIVSSSYEVTECSTGVDFVDCAGGYLVGDTSVSCATACGGNCCVDTQACFMFTGKVCKDGSCGGSFACAYAKIPLVVNSCKNSSYQCYMAGSGAHGSSIAGMKNSCNGASSCQYLGMGNAAGAGKVGYVIDSCNGFVGCSNAGYTGTIGLLKNSCNGDYACVDLARNGGKSGNVRDSCNAGYSCDSAAKGTSNFIGDISRSCNAFQACRYLSGTNSTNLYSCCNSDNECKSNNATSLPAQCLLTAPPSSAPTNDPTTATPSKTPTVQPSTASPSSIPTSSSPTPVPTPTSKPTNKPTISRITPNTKLPTKKPTIKPTKPKKKPRTKK